MDKLATLVLLVMAAIATGLGDKFEIVAERQILEIPCGVRPNQCGALSPDGRSVLTVKAGRLTIRRLESPQERELLPQLTVSMAGATAGWASWSGDGKWIYYLQRADQAWINNLWRVEVSSLKRELLIENAGTAPSPSPDDQSIAFYRGQKLMLVGRDGGNERVLLERDLSRFLVWAPDSAQILLSANWTVLTVASGQVKNTIPGERQRHVHLLAELEFPVPFCVSLSVPPIPNGSPLVRSGTSACPTES